MTERSRLTNLATKPKRLGSEGEAGAADADKPKGVDKRRTERALPARCISVSELQFATTLDEKRVATLGDRSA